MTLQQHSSEAASERRGLTESGEREVSAILSDVWENGEKLARQEIALGLAELQVRANELKRALLEGALLGACYYAGGLTLLAAIVLGLSELMMPWLAATIVGVLAIAGGYALQRRAASHAERALSGANAPQSGDIVANMKEASR